MTVNAGNINKTKTLPLPIEEEWRQATSEDHDLRYIKKTLFSPEETPIDPKYLRNKGYVKHSQQGRLDLDNVLIFYCDNPLTARVRQIRLRVVPVKFSILEMAACHIYPLSGHRHEQRTLYRILEWFWWPMVNKEVAQFIRA